MTTPEAKSASLSSGQSGTSGSPGMVALSDWLFYCCLGLIGGVYVLLILAMLTADVAYMVDDSIEAASRPHLKAKDAVEEAERSLERAKLRLQQTRQSSELQRQAVDDAQLAADQAKKSIDEASRAIQQAGSKSTLMRLLQENPIVVALGDRKIRYSIWLSLISCSLTAILSVFVAVPIGYLLARHRFWGRRFIDAVLDIPIVLPPLVIGLSLLILFQFWPLNLVARSIVYQVPAVILAQFAVACAFAVRTMKATFDHINPRCEEVALTLGCTRFQAFGWVVLPEATRGMTTALTLSWARALGEFGPLLIFAGATRMKTEVLSTSVFLELNVGNISGAVAVSLIMVFAAMIVLILARMFGSRELSL